MAQKTHPLSLAKKKYARHKAQSKFRSIDFNLTFDEWYNWWLQQGVDKNQDTFKLQDPNRLCMCRYNDLGPYQLGNIYCANHVDNVKDAYEKGTLKQRVEIGNQKKLEKEKYKEWKKLCIQYRLEHGSINSNMYWPTSIGTYVKTKLEARKLSQLSQYMYDKYIALGTFKRKFIGKTFEEFVKENSIYKEPYSYALTAPTNVTYHRKKTK